MPARLPTSRPGDARTYPPLGVSRRTLYGWRRSEKFVAALECWRADMEQVTRSRLLNLSSMGLRAIHRALEAGDAKVALAMFKGLGIFNPPPEPTTRDTVIYRREVDRGKSAGRMCRGR